MENQTYNPVEDSPFDSLPLSPKPNNNLPLAIVSTVLGCCTQCGIGFILGIVAIVFSSQVNSKYDAKDYDGAANAAKTTKILSFIALALFAMNIIYLIYLISTNQFQEMIESFMEQYQKDF
ncbi:MAG: CD225/dispanin family protein [Flavobacteriaceae bacterium]|jgi:hypothetical protein|nr:CD225/dispanin family protein [Flavobacteriaceae bacterium]